MAAKTKPDLELARKVLLAPLFQALIHIFAQGIEGTLLAGGTALASFYAGHRRSDDLDLFTTDESHQRSCTLAIQSISKLGGSLRIQNTSSQYFEAMCELKNHRFKITAVTDSNLFQVGASIRLNNDVQITDLETLFKMKAATLVSRCSEKDLYDLIWLFGHFPDRTFSDLIRLGSEIDGGTQGEAMLSSLGGAILHKEACDFSLNSRFTAAHIFSEVQEFRKKLIRGITAHLEDEPAPALGELVKKLDKISKN